MNRPGATHAPGPGLYRFHDGQRQRLFAARRHASVRRARIVADLARFVGWARLASGGRTS
jgi:hypothetical protein